MLRSFNNATGSIVVLDTGLLLEYLSGTPAGKSIETMVFENDYMTSVLVTPLTLVEIYYLIRRKATKERAKEEIEKIKKLVRVVPLEDYLENMGELKATTGIALADVATIACAERSEGRALFKHETELDGQLQGLASADLSSRIVFIDDFPAIAQPETPSEYHDA